MIVRQAQVKIAGAPPRVSESCKMSGSHKHDHKHGHKHAHGQARNRRRLRFVLALTVIYMLAEAVGGFLTNSLALLSDAGHMLTDVAGLALAMFALWFSSRPVTHSKTYGYYRMEILAALANGVTLVVISLLIFYEALQRLKQPQPVQGFEVMLIAMGGLVVNGISAWVLSSASKENLNMRGAFLHVIGDALGSVGAIAAGLAVWRWGWSPADPLISIAIGLLIIFSSWQLIRESVNVLLEGTPSHINIAAVLEAMHEVEGVLNVHDLHVWTISSGNEALSAHVRIEQGAPYKATLEAIQQRLSSGFNIGHLTIQLELPEEGEAEERKLYQIIPRSEAQAEATGTRASRKSAATRQGKE
ncbi:MAG TPA: cation diffusion facilitator family transporter [Blastocatellia bacterium]|nr:cation diffusion facilitator family transporter [Blastocatellia bacterium]